MKSKKTNSCRVITAAINKGGTGKTTTVLSFSVLIAAKGFKTLVIDGDPQRNTTAFAGAEIVEDETITLEDLFINVNETTPDIAEPVDKEYIKAAIQSTENGFDIIPCTNALASIENQYNGYTHLFTLKRICDAIRDEYDFIIIDTPPASNTLAGCSIVAADDVIIPIEPSGSVQVSVENNVFFMKTLIEATGKMINVDRIVITSMPSGNGSMIEQIENLSEVSEAIFGCKVAKPYIRENIPFKRCFNLQSTILESMREERPQALFDYVKVVEAYLDEHHIKHESFVKSKKLQDGQRKDAYIIPFMSKKKVKPDNIPN